MPSLTIPWVAILSNGIELSEHAKKKLHLLRLGYSQGADFDLKKIPGYNLYTIRLNHSDRLLFTFIMTNGKTYLLVLEVILNHDYQKSRFLKPGVLRSFLEKHSETLLETVDASSFEELSDKDISEIENFKFHETTDSTPDSSMPLKKVLFSKHRTIVLDSEQFEASQLNMPLLVSGPPGSGKSSALLALISKEISKQEETPIVCISQSQFLIQHLETMWQAQPDAYDEEGNLNENVRFVSHIQFLEELIQSTELKLTEKGHFENFWKHYLLKPEIKKTTLSQLEIKDVYQEFGIIAPNAEQYLKLGERHSLISNTEIRTHLLNAYQNYIGILNRAKLFHPAFSTLPQISQKFRIIIDESQDFNLKTLKELFEIAEEGKFGLFVDPNQSLIASINTLSRLEEIVREICPFTPLQSIALKTPYRSARSILDLANVALAIKNHIYQGTSYKGELLQIDVPADLKKGTVDWYQQIPSNAEEFTLFFYQILQQCDMNETQIAIVTHAHHLDALKELTSHPLIFTPEQIKGLEFKTVLLFLPLNTASMREVNALLPTEGELSLFQHRAPRLAPFHLGPDLNKILVMCTRASDHLFLLQPTSEHQLTRVIELFKTKLTTPLKTLSLAAPTPVLAIAQQQDWDKMCQSLIATGNILQAEKIFNAHLNDGPLTFQDLVAKLQTPSHGVRTIKKALPSKKLTQKRFALELLKNHKQHHFSSLIDSPGISTLLFEIKMPNGHCLFVNLCSHKKVLESFLFHLRQSSPIERQPFIRALQNAYPIAIKNQDNYLKLWLAYTPFKEFLITKVKLPTAKRSHRTRISIPPDVTTVISIAPPIQEILQDLRGAGERSQFGNLWNSSAIEMSERPNGAALSRPRDTLEASPTESLFDLIINNGQDILPHLTLEDLCSQYIHRDQSRGFSFLHLLAYLEEFQCLELFPKLKQALLQGFHDETDTKITFPFLFARSFHGITILKQNPDILKKIFVDDLAKKTFISGNHFIAELCPPQGGVEFISLYWEEFKPFIDTELLNFEIIDTINKAPNVHIFYAFCNHFRMPAIMNKDWETFRPFINREMLYRPVRIDGKITTALERLLDCPAGMDLIIERWGDFKNWINDLTNSQDNSIDPFTLLMQSTQGLEFINNHWIEVKERITPDYLTRVKKINNEIICPLIDMLQPANTQCRALILNDPEFFKEPLISLSTHSNAEENLKVLRNFLLCLPFEELLNHHQFLNHIISNVYHYENASEKPIIDLFYNRTLIAYKKELEKTPFFSQDSVVLKLLQAINQPQTLFIEEGQIALLKQDKTLNNILSNYARIKEITLDEFLNSIFVFHESKPEDTMIEKKSRTF